MKFEEILTEYNVDFITEGHHHAGEGWIQIDCPYCGRDSKKWHLGFRIGSAYLNCWRCGHLPLAKTFADLANISLGKALSVLKSLDRDVFQQEKIKVKGKLILPKGVVDLLPAHKKYLKQRGFDPILMKKLWNVQCIGIASKLSWRLFIPITYRNQVVSWTTRTISDKEGMTRYISAPKEHEAIPHKELLFGEEYLRHCAIVLEGPTDVFNVGPGSCCTFGLGYSPAQVLKLSKYPVRVICFDHHSIAQKKAKQLCDELSIFPGETYNVVLKASDPGSATRKEIDKLRRIFL